MLRHASLFTGIGGFEIAAERAEMSNVAMCEIDSPASTVLRHHWPDTPLWADVSDLDGATVPADVITAGSPCQDFSIAGMRRGLAGSRSGLFEHVIRLRDEMQPRFVVWENVPGALTSNKGEDFANVIGALVGSPEPLRLPKHPNGRRSRYAGVAHGPKGTLAWRVLDAQHFGVPQRRQRIIAVLDTQGWASIPILFPDAPDNLGGARQLVIRGGAWAMPLDRDDLPFDTGMDVGAHPRVRLADILESDVDERYYLSQKACIGILRRANKRGRALPEVLDYALRFQAGEVVGEPPAYEPVCVTGERTHALKAEGHDGSEDGTGRGQPIVPEVAACVTSGTGMRYDAETETLVPVRVASTLQGGGRRGYRIGAEDAAGGHLVPVLMKQREGKPGGGKGPLLSEDMSLTLATGNDQMLFEPVSLAENQRGELRTADIAPAMSIGGGKPGQGYQAVLEPQTFGKVHRASSKDDAETRAQRDVSSTLNLFDLGDTRSQDVIVEPPHYRVRRLTPTECERLQGFPDRHTVVDGAKDSARYRQLGNAVAVPVATWVLSRIAEVAR